MQIKENGESKPAVLKCSRDIMLQAKKRISRGTESAEPKLKGDKPWMSFRTKIKRFAPFAPTAYRDKRSKKLDSSQVTSDPCLVLEWKSQFSGAIGRKMFRRVNLVEKAKQKLHRCGMKMTKEWIERPSWPAAPFLQRAKAKGNTDIVNGILYDSGPSPASTKYKGRDSSAVRRTPRFGK